MIGQEPQPEIQMAPLLRAVLAETFRTLAAKPGIVLKLLAPPFLLGLVFDYTVPFESGLWADLLRMPYYLLIWTPFAVAWMRLVLLQDASSARLIPTLSRRHLRVAGYALLLNLLDVLLLIYWYLFVADPAVPQFPNATYWLAYTFIGCVKLRFAFVYPAMAVDESYGLRQAWQHSRPAAPVLFLLFIGTVILPLAGLSYSLEFAYLHLTEHAALLYGWWLLWHVTSWIVEAIYATFVAVAFRRCSGWIPPPDREIVERFA